MENIFEEKGVDLKMNIALGYILRNRRDDSLRFFHPSYNSNIFPLPTQVNTPEDMAPVLLPRQLQPLHLAPVLLHRKLWRGRHDTTISLSMAHKVIFIIITRQLLKNIDRRKGISIDQKNLTQSPILYIRYIPILWLTLSIDIQF